MGNNAKEKPDKPQSHDCRISLHFTEQEHVYLEHHQSLERKMHQKQTFITKGTRKLFSFNMELFKPTLQILKT